MLVRMKKKCFANLILHSQEKPNDSFSEPDAKCVSIVISLLYFTFLPSLIQFIFFHSLGELSTVEHKKCIWVMHEARKKIM